ncbi:MAG: C10 family peptidase [Candidatus Zixiibacteriota bacterium]
MSNNYCREIMRNYRKYIIILIIILLLSGADKAKSELASRTEMDQVALNWLTKITHDKSYWSGSQAPSISNSWELKSGDTDLARVYDIDPQGFIVVPVLKEMVPVKLYSEESNLDSDQEGGVIALLREMLGSRMNHYRRAFGSLDISQPVDGEALFGRNQKLTWDKMTLPSEEFEKTLHGSTLKSLEEAGPLLTSSWHQRSPYNDYCPIGYAGRTVVGCVATAAAQILYYWQWPPNGIGTHTYTWDGDNSCTGHYTNGMELSVDLSDTYDWVDMADSCDEGCSEITNVALAELNYEVAVAFNMDFGACGSASYGSLGVHIYPELFAYNSDIQLIRRSDYDLVGWYDVVREEVDNARPMHYRINYHNIVCDGYRQSIPGQYEYHMNYGWGNGFNAWFVLDSLYCYWVPPDSICPSEEDYMLINIYPQMEPILDYVGFTLNDDEAGGNGDGIANTGETIALDLTIKNRGAQADNISGTLSTADTYINITSAAAIFDGSLTPGESGTTQTPYEIVIDPLCPDNHVAIFEHVVQCNGNLIFTDTFYLFVGQTGGFTDDFEAGVGYWTHDHVVTGFSDEWHLESYRKQSGEYSWKAGGPGGEDYYPSLDAALITPPFLLPHYPMLNFWHWFGTEEAYDGGIVMISAGDGNWEQIFPEGGYPSAITTNPACALPGGTPCYSGYQDWSLETFDLSSYSGVVQLMFRFVADGAVNDEGWYIDDVSVKGKYMCGDVSNNGVINILDITDLISFLYKNGSAPVSIWAADLNGDGTVNILDVTYLIAFLYKSGPDPDCN